MLSKKQIESLPGPLRLELLKRAQSKAHVVRLAKLLETLHPKQRAFVCDPARRKAALCSRRAGKSWGIAAWLIEGALSDPGGLSVFVARSKNNSRLIVGAALQEIEAKFKFGIWLHEVDNQLMAEFPNKHKIWLAGAKDSSETTKFRGMAYRRVAIDEAQGYGEYLREMVADVFQPALIDKQGEMALAGTPAPVPAGLFYEATTGDGGPQWSTHHWTILDNPYIPDARAELEGLKEAFGWNDEHPTFRREYMGLWVRDDGALVYPWSPLRNACSLDAEPGSHLALPEGRYRWVMGVDLGYEDSTAFVVAGNRVGFPDIYVVHCEERQHLVPSAVAAHVERLWREHKLSAVVVDEGALGKGYGEEMRQRFALPVRPAEKTKKRAFQEFVAGGLKAGTIKIDPARCRPLINELTVLPWDAMHEREDERFPNHCADAFLYACRELRPFYRPEENPPVEGSKDWWDAQRLKFRRQAERRVLMRLRRGESD